MFLYNLLQHFHQLGLHRSRTPKFTTPTSILPSNPRQFFIIFQKETQPLIAHIHLQISSQLLLQFLRVSSSREGMGFDFPFNFLGRVRQEDCRVGIATAHLSLCSLERWEELGMDQRWLALQRMVAWYQLVGNVARESKVWVLVDGTGNETRQRGRIAFAAAQHVWEGASEGGRRLNRREGNLSDIRPTVKTKYAIDLIDRHGLPNTDNVGIHPTDILQIRKQKGLVG
mmetsp:Transcript_24935/g.44884  ORF Transcript_24935/g.44884 Transcript_24935/m.44884 type:complete len:228 (-) Transcript_24935:1669-2352(-)